MLSESRLELIRDNTDSPRGLMLGAKAVPSSGRLGEVERALMFSGADFSNDALTIDLSGLRFSVRHQAADWKPQHGFDLHLDGDKSSAVFREETMNDKDTRLVPLLPEIAQALKESRPANADASKKVFWFQWPTYDILRGQLKKAGIPHKDSVGRVVHFHSFRKSFASIAAKHGIPLTVVQQILGPSTPALTANIYTDINANMARAEMVKMPWISGNSQTEKGANSDATYGAYICGISSPAVSLTDIIKQLQELSQATGTEG